jgi:GAF domain-containing protein
MWSSGLVLQAEANRGDLAGANLGRPPWPKPIPRAILEGSVAEGVRFVAMEPKQAPAPGEMRPIAQRIPSTEGSGGNWTRAHVEALLRVSKAAAFSSSLDHLLKVIAREACQVTDAVAVSILRSEPGGRFRLAASVGHSDRYREFLEGEFIASGRSLTRIAADRLRPIVVDDLATDPIVDEIGADEGRRFAEEEGIAAVVLAPLVSGGRAFGVMGVCRGRVAWTSSEVELVATFARHAAAAIDGARLLQAQRRQVGTLEKVVRVLHEQTHEYANRLHALAGLQALGDAEEAERFLDHLISLHHDNYASVVERVQPSVLAGLLIAQMSIARQRGVEMVLDRRSCVERLPRSLGHADAVTIVANLVDNAVEEVTEMAPPRRRASVWIRQDDEALRIAVRDWGRGLSGRSPREIFARGRSSKPGHPGVGLALVADTIASVDGTIEVEPRDPGSEFTVLLPMG